MRFSGTTLEYRPFEGNFIVSTKLKGLPEPLVKRVPEFNLRFIGDQDINAMVEHAKMFPNHAHHVVRHRIAA